uniref:Helitron_like_N domain-containing protein n=2 Tax=Caenorhabditis tropicalis TaxID=1561998 RepID=A0A1I7TVT8_9PELO
MTESNEKRSMSDDEIKLAADYITKSLAVFKNVIEIGKTKVERLKNETNRLMWTRRLTGITGIAEMIRGVMMLIPKGENPLVKDIEELTEKVEELGDRVGRSFDDLKSVIAEINFFVKIVGPTFVLGRYMRDCIEHPSKRATGNFKRAYKKHPPFKLFYNLTTCLERSSSNPLRMAMDAEKVHSRETFDRWEEMIYMITAQLMILEAFANGLLEFKTKNNLDLLITRATTAYDELVEWRKEYSKKNHDAYWKDIKEYVEKHTTTYPKMTNAERADDIQNRLDTYLTQDAFYILVFNVSTVDREHSYHCPKAESQMIGVWNKGRCNVIVYRSHLANRLENNVFVKVENEVRACKEGKFKNVGTLRNVIQTQLLDSNSVRGDGFVGLVDLSKDLQVRSAYCSEHMWGPGWWEKVVFVGRPEVTRTLIVSFP